MCVHVWKTTHFHALVLEHIAIQTDWYDAFLDDFLFILDTMFLKGVVLGNSMHCKAEELLINISNSQFETSKCGSTGALFFLRSSLCKWVSHINNLSIVVESEGAGNSTSDGSVGKSP